MIRPLTLIILATAIAHGEPVDGLSLPVRTVTISSPVQEIVDEVFVEEGQNVTADQILARLLDAKEKIEFDRAEKVLEKREFDFKAAQNLARDKILSREKALESEAERALARLDRDLASALVQEKTIRSPIDGVIVRRFREPGESVDRVGPLFQVVNIDQLFLQFYVPPEIATRLQKGKTIPFKVADGSETPQTHQAKVDFISPAADPSSGLLRVKLLYENKGHHVKAGLRVTAEF